MQKLILSQGWEFKKRDIAKSVGEDFADPEDWLPASVPGTVHQDLLSSNQIPDPFFGLNEQAVQWVGEVDWLYRCRFEVPINFESATNLDLCCDGLDTFATVWLNNEHLFSSDNMFVPHRVSVHSYLQPGQTNELRFLFEAALQKGRDREKAEGQKSVWNGDSSRVYARKAQYHYGWDWGPTLLTAGIWQEVRLEAYDIRITQLDCPVEVAPDLAQAELLVKIELSSNYPVQALSSNPLLQLTLYGPDNLMISETTIELATDTAEVNYKFEVSGTELDLWWPNGHGKQPLYLLKACLKILDEPGEEYEELDCQEIRLGLRRLRLVQEPLLEEEGTSFLFEVNNKPIFCNGANWIPADSFTPRISAKKYRALLDLAANANLVMLRVWGGGIYEPDIFYECCDELGILVWQDFMFACGIYPATEQFVESVKAEATAVLQRLRHHPSIALWCGNNEDYMLADTLGVYDPDFNEDFRITPFPARYIYEQILPQICEKLDPNRPYWPGSPYGGAKSNSQNIGDRHTWEIWHQEMAPYQDYPKYAGRFVSEFGMQAYPQLSTIKAFTSSSFELHPQSRTLEFHNKGDGGSRRLAAYVSDTLRVENDLESYIYATQYVQAEAVAAAIRGWRRKWGGAGHYSVAGALVWQLNDCWPAISWAVIDYFLHPKPAYYTLRRECNAQGLGLGEITKSKGVIAVWGFNNSFKPIYGTLVLKEWSFDGSLISEKAYPVCLKANQTTEFGEFQLSAINEPASIVVNAVLVVNENIVATTNLWPQPLKYLDLPDPQLELIRVGADQIRLQATKPAHGVWLEVSDLENVYWEDNFIDLMPGEERVIRVKGLGEKTPIKIKLPNNKSENIQKPSNS